MPNKTTQFVLRKSTQLMRREGKYAILHKQDKEKGGNAVGKEFSFPSGTQYVVQPNGSVVRSTPKLKGKYKKGKV